jgi:hypothetical protein
VVHSGRAARKDRTAIGPTVIELDAPAGARAVATSVRLPAVLHRAAVAAVDAGLAGSLTELVVAGLDATLEDRLAGSADRAAAADVRAALDAHYAEHPDARPEPIEIAQAAATITDHPAAERPDLLANALADLGDDAPLDDVLAWARGALAAEARLHPTGA